MYNAEMGEESPFVGLGGGDRAHNKGLSMTPELMTKYDLRVPRYTSYPTAPHFSDDVDGETYARWLGALDPTSPLSIYTHIPFCDEMCWFCGCYTKIVKQYKPVSDYLRVLIDEISLVADALPGRMQASHLHWGGGSPTMLSGGDWRRILDHLRSRFRLESDAEIAVELDPRTTTEDYVRSLAEAGVNRTSIGVQDFDPGVQQAINRIQPYETTKRVVAWMRAQGISNLNMDLMYGLPHQTTDKVLRMVEKVFTLRPQRIALFGYAHVPWMKTHQKLIPEETLPGAEARLEQFERASERLLEGGYVRVGLDHFALPEDTMSVALTEGRLHRNFQGYTTDRAPVMIGLGASAIGQLPQGYVQNGLPLKGYRTAIESGRLATAKGVALSPEDRLRADLIERLMCDLRVDLGEICRRHGASDDHFTKELSALAPLVDDGICRIEGGIVTVPEEARAFVRLVSATFDAYLKKGQKRHSKAV